MLAFPQRMKSLVSISRCRHVYQAISWKQLGLILLSLCGLNAFSRLQEDFAAALKDYVGRESPLYHAERLSEHYRQ